MRVFIIFFGMWVSIFAQLLDYDVKPLHFQSQKINILDSKEFKSPKVDGIKITEISDLDFRDGVLYGLSDQGFLYSFSLVIKDKKLKEIKPLRAVRLKTKKAKELKKSKTDAEGLCYVDDKLLISFERKPRISYFSLDGIKLKNAKIDKRLLDIDNYRSKNKALESVTYSKKYGVVTAPELPLKTQDISTHTIFTKKGEFRFVASGCITSLEFIGEDRVLVLMRDYSYLSGHLVVTLLSVDLLNGDVDTLLKMDSQKGWKIDNFEGLSKVGDNLYLVVSDDNENSFQKTLFVLFELK